MVVFNNKVMLMDGNEVKRFIDETKTAIAGKGHAVTPIGIVNGFLYATVFTYDDWYRPQWGINHTPTEDLVGIETAFLSELDTFIVTAIDGNRYEEEGENYGVNLYIRPLREYDPNGDCVFFEPEEDDDE